MVRPAVLESDAVRCFGVFATHLNFTTAAAALHLSQPSLHAKVQALQRDLGVPLYRKTGRQLILTDAGARVARYARDSGRRAEDLFAGLHESGLQVSIAAGRATCRWVIADGLRRISESGRDLRLTTTDRPAAVRAVLDGTVDLAVVAHDPPPASLQARVLSTYPQILLVHRTHRLAERSTVMLSDLDGSRLVAPPSDRPHRKALARALSDAGVTWTIGAEVDGWDLHVQLVEAGLGLAVVNGCVPVPSGLIGLPVTDLPDITYWTAWRAERADLVAETLAALHTRS